MRLLIFILISIMSFFFSSEIIAQKTTNAVVVIDAGHGGRDPGNLASSEKYKNEKDINLIIALKTGNYIDSLLSGVQVVYTRKTDTYISVPERAEIANKTEADYFISIHCNSNPDSTINGTEVHIHNFKCKTSYKFAQKLDRQFKNKALRHSRGIKTYSDRNNSNLLVVKNTEMPAVLVECGFMSNPDEEYYLNTDYGQSIIASAIYRAFRDYSDAKRKTSATPADYTKYYRVQILSSSTKVALDIPEFKKLDETVYEIIGKDTEIFRYKYCVGKVSTFSEAELLRKKVANKGFDDAFVVPPSSTE